MTTDNTWPAMEVLRRAHEAAQHHLGQLSQALDALKEDEVKAIEEALSFLETELAEHFNHEEQALFVVLERVIGRMGPIGVMLDEHQAFKRALASFKQAWVQWKASEAQDDELQRLGSHIVWLLSSHIDKENGILFSMAEEALQPALKVEVNERMKELTPQPRR